jgi:hypothetical protein
MVDLTLIETVELQRRLSAIKTRFNNEMNLALEAEQKSFAIEILARRKDAEKVQRMERVWRENANFIELFKDERDKNFARRILWQEYDRHYEVSVNDTEVCSWEIFGEDRARKAFDHHYEPLLTRVRGTFIEACLCAVTMNGFYKDHPWGDRDETAEGGRIDKIYEHSFKDLG